MAESNISHNCLAFIALSNEFCQAVENAREAERTDFVDTMLRLLPRIYITVSDIPEPSMQMESSYIPGALEEDYYESVRRAMEALMGEDDTFLEVFEDDMKFSDTPIASSISENLADIFQVLYNMLENIKDAPEMLLLQTIDIVKEDFGSYWSRPLCNVLRALNTVKYQ